MKPKRTLNVLISHYKIVPMAGRFIPVKQCSRQVGENFQDSYGTSYQVMKDYSIRRISAKRRG